jgi:hypothetical protein
MPISIKIMITACITLVVFLYVEESSSWYSNVRKAAKAGQYASFAIIGTSLLTFIWSL